MKKRFILLSSTLLLSFFMLSSVDAQQKATEATKSKTEIEAPAKCAACPSAATCKGEAAVSENKKAQKEMEAKKQKPVATNEKKKKK